MNILKLRCINLKKRADRHFEAETELTHHGIDFEFVEGIDGIEMGYQAFTGTDNEKGSPGDIGCKNSHLKVAKQARDLDAKNYLVFEDDVELSKDFQSQFAEYIKELPDDWDMLYFGGNHDKPIFMVSKHIAKMSRTFTTHAIAINAKAYDQVIEVLENNDKVDLCLSSLHAKLNCYVFQPHLAWQREGFSDILNKKQDYKHLRNYRYIPLGLRCSSAGMIDKYFTREESLPLDWVDIPMRTIRDISQLSEDQIPDWVNAWISKVDLKTLKSPDGTWFPHDFVDEANASYDLQVKHVSEKYIRRFKRLFSLFTSRDILVFLTIIPKFNRASEDPVFYGEIKRNLAAKATGQCIFVTINLLEYEEAMFDPKNNLSINLNVQLHHDWAEFEKEIAGRLKSYPHSSKYFPDKQG